MTPLAGRRLGAATVLACAGFLGSWTLLHHGWYGSHQLVDTPSYESWGDRTAAGAVPYRDFPLEYPPGALAAFVAPELTARRGDLGSYGRAFEKWMAGCGVALVLLVGAALAALRAPAERAAAALGLAALSPLLLGNVLLSRFDLLPAVLTVGALAALLWGRRLLSAVVLAAAIDVKLYPALLAPLALVYVWRRHGRRDASRWATVLVGVTTAVFLPFAILAPGGLAHSFGTQLSRPLQIESLGSALLIAAHHVAGVTLTLGTSHGSQNIENGAANWVGAASSALQLCAIVWIWFAFARGEATRERLVLGSAAAVAAFVALGKVFSPQYLIWLVPLVALVRARAALATLTAALVLTQLWFPDRYWQLALGLRPAESWLLLARDLVVVALLGVLARELQHEPLREDRPVREALEPVGRQVEARAS